MQKIKNDHKRLQRDDENGRLAGVCAGLGEYFNVDPTLIRLLFVLFTLLGGQGILLYIILAIVMPGE